MPLRFENASSLRKMRIAVVRNLAGSWHDAMAATLAGLLAWLLSYHLLGHAQPLFATITAIVCLAPGLPSHAKQAVGMLVGVTTGMVIGELALFLPGEHPLLRISFTAFFAIFIASAYGLSATVPIQSGVSAILVLAMGPATAGTFRLLDVCVGASVGLLFSQILTTPDAARMVRVAGRRYFSALESGFRVGAEALAQKDAVKAEKALQTFLDSYGALLLLNTALADARSSMQWSIRGKLSARTIGQVVARYDRRNLHLFASVLLLGEAIVDGIRSGAEPPAGLVARLEKLAVQSATLAQNVSPDEDESSDALAHADFVQTPWYGLYDRLGTVERIMAG